MHLCLKKQSKCIVIYYINGWPYRVSEEAGEAEVVEAEEEGRWENLVPQGFLAGELG